MTAEQIESSLKAMHEGLLGMQARLDDHQKVIEQLMLVMQYTTASYYYKLSMEVSDECRK